MRYSIKVLLKVLTYREFLGYYFEDYCKRALEPWIREATPDNPVEWKRWIGKGADIKLKDNTEIECKYVESYVYASAVLRHVLPRFSQNATERIVLTNNKKKWTRKARELLELNGIFLRTIDEEIKERIGGTVYSCIRVREDKEYYSINSHCKQPNTSNYNHVQPSPDMSESVKISHLAVETLDPSVKCFGWVRMMGRHLASLDVMLSKVTGYLKLLKSLLIYPLKLGKRFSQQGMVDRIRIDGSSLNLLNCKQIEEVSRNESSCKENMGIENKPRDREYNS